MTARLEALGSFITTRRLSRPGLDRARFLALQDKALHRWLARSVPQVQAFAGPPRHLDQWPVMDKATLMADFARYNVAGLTADQVRTAMARDFRIGPYTVGASTGTSGNRGYFVISERERYRWLGSILAKTMADLLWRKQRVAILLPQGTALYESANQLRQIRLAFFDVTAGPASWQDRLERFDPTLIVAAPRILRHMVEHEFRLRPSRVFSAAETLDPVDRPIIEAGFGQPLGQIYMATEGLLGVTCRHGRLHLAEDSVHFTFEPVGDGLVTPLISSFRRDAQILLRYRMNDLLRLDPSPCPCGAPQQVVSEVVGRMDDCFDLRGPQGREMVTPDLWRNAIIAADPRITDFRLIQTDPARITLILPPALPQDAALRAEQQLTTVLAQRGLVAEITLLRQALPLDPLRKLRRVERRIPQAGDR